MEEHDELDEIAEAVEQEQTQGKDKQMENEKWGGNGLNLFWVIFCYKL